MAMPLNAQRPTGAMRTKPEGPYETADVSHQFGTSSHQMAQFIYFIEQLEEETQGTLSIKQALENSQNRVDALMRSHGHY